LTRKVLVNKVRRLRGNGACFSFADAVACQPAQVLCRQEVGGNLCRL